MKMNITKRLKIDWQSISVSCHRVSLVFRRIARRDSTRLSFHKKVLQSLFNASTWTTLCSFLCCARCWACVSKLRSLISLWFRRKKVHVAWALCSMQAKKSWIFSIWNLLQSRLTVMISTKFPALWLDFNWKCCQKSSRSSGEAWSFTFLSLHPPFYSSHFLKRNA